MDEKSWEFFRKAVSRISPTAEQEQYSYFRVVKEHFRPGMRWLDGGCGHTLVPDWMKGAAALEQYFLSNAEMIVGTDIDPVSLAKHSPIKRVACNLEQICFPDNTFDIVTCNMVVEHLPNPLQSFREFHRVLKPGGVAIVHTPNVLNWINLVAKLTPHSFHTWARGILAQSGEEDVFPTLYRSNTPRRLHNDLCKAGFEDVEILPFSGRPLPVASKFLIVAQSVVHRLVSSVPDLREILCAVAKKRTSVSPTCEKVDAVVVR